VLSPDAFLSGPSPGTVPVQMTASSTVGSGATGPGTTTSNPALQTFLMGAWRQALRMYTSNGGLSTAGTQPILMAAVPRPMAARQGVLSKWGILRGRLRRSTHTRRVPQDVSTYMPATAPEYTPEWSVEGGDPFMRQRVNHRSKCSCVREKSWGRNAPSGSLLSAVSTGDGGHSCVGSWGRNDTSASAVWRTAEWLLGPTDAGRLSGRWSVWRQ